jgi:hypothetical protein
LFALATLACLASMSRMPLSSVHLRIRLPIIPAPQHDSHLIPPLYTNHGRESIARRKISRNLQIYLRLWPANDTQADIRIALCRVTQGYYDLRLSDAFLT